MTGLFDFMEDRVGKCERKRTYQPRPYQREADIAVAQYLADRDKCGLYMATGTGKTEVAALLLSRAWDGGALFVTPRRELVVQSADRLRLRGVPCGIEMAEQRSDEPVTVACYASLRSRNRYQRFLQTTKFIIVDESHLNYSPAALEMLAEFREWGAKVCGMTASPPTSKTHPLSDHYGEAAYIYDYLRACNDGYLLTCKMHLCVLDDLDMSRFRASFGDDFNQNQVSRLLKTKANVAAVGGMVETYWEGLPSVVFCSSISHAELVRDDLWGRGIQASIVHSQMEPHEVQQHMRDFMEGTSQIIINVGILTLGWDAPHVRKLFIARCTASPTLYTQIFGRGTRCLPGIIDGLATAQERLDAIARSDKPFFEIFDITDSSRNNDIKTAMDIVRPGVDDRLMKRIRRRMETGTVHALDIDAIIAEEQKLMAAEQAAKDKIELQRRLNIRVDADVKAYERDPLSDSEARPRKKVTDFWWMPYGRYKGRSFSKIPRWYLETILPHVRDEGLARNIRRFLYSRSA